MANITSVGLTAGLGTSGTGTISTLDNLIGTAGTASAQVLTVQGIASGTAQPISISTGANTAVVKAASTAPVATDPSLVVSLSPNSVNANGQATMANSAPVVIASNQTNLPVINGASKYNTVAASQSTQALTGGGGGATGDYLAGVLVIPATTSPGVVSVIDNATTIVAFPGGASSVSNLVPFYLPLGAVSSSGAWKITTGANVSCVAVGKFT